MLEKIIDEKLISAHGVVGIFRANSVGDDIKVYSEDDKEVATLHGLRQQVGCWRGDVGAGGVLWRGVRGEGQVGCWEECVSCVCTPSCMLPT